MPSSYIVADCETGGLLATENPITELAAAVLDPLTLRVQADYQTYVQPYGAEWVVSKEALQHSQVTLTQLNNGNPFKKACAGFIELCKVANPTGKKRTRPILIGHNIGFDVDFLVVLFYLSNKNLWDYIHPVPIDTIQQLQNMEAGTLAKDESTMYSLGVCCQRLGITLKNAHGAMADVLATTELFKAITLLKRTAYKAMRTGAKMAIETGGKTEPHKTKQRTEYFFEI